MAPWRAFDTFASTLAASFATALFAMAVATYRYTRHGALDVASVQDLLNGLYIVTYPLGFVALVALFWHFVRFYRGEVSA